MTKQTLEEYFYSFENDLSVFPGSNNYVSSYKKFKQFMDQHVHPEVKSFVTRLNHKVYLNDHSERHVRMVIEKVSQILNPGPDFNVLTPYECFLLLTAIQIHDAGHIPDGRENHAERAGDFLEQFNKYDIATPERVMIFQIAKAHSGTDDPIGALQIEEDYSNEKVHLRMLAALLRIGDEMADERSRGSGYLLDKGCIEEKSRIFHAFSCCLHTFIPRMQSHDVLMKFSIPRNLCKEEFITSKGKTYLLDEIYTRTIKTFQECLYYNRFVQEKLAITSVYVKIDFIDDNEVKAYFDSISYKLEEKGYPTHLSNDIFSLCGDALTNKKGNQLDGAYVSSQV